MIRTFRSIGVTTSMLLISMMLATTATASGIPEKKAVTNAKPAKTWPIYGNVFHRSPQGTYYLDPVCGRYGVVEETKMIVKVAGKSYCFDADSCMKQFQVNTARFIGALALPAQVYAIAGQKLTVIDPVSDEKVLVGIDKPYRDYRAKRYFFSGDSTANLFESDPARYSVNAKPKP